MAKRMSRGGGAALYAARQAADVVVAPEDMPDPVALTVVEEPEEDEDEVVEPAVEEDDEEEEDDEPDEEEEDDDEPEDDGLSIMQRQLAKLEAENVALKREKQDAEDSETVTQHAIIKNALAGAKAAVDAAEADIERASAAGDHKGVAKATRAMAKAQADAERFELAADELAGEIEDRKVARKNPQPAPREPDADGYKASIQAFSKPSQDWLIKHRKAIEGNQKAGMKARALAQVAIADGIEVDSPEFFAYLDNGMGFKNVKKEQKPVGKKRKPEPARPAAAAPGGTRGGSGGSVSVTLTKAERDAARNMGMTNAEYARNKLEIDKNGQDPNRPGLRFSSQTAHSSRR